MRVIDTLDIDAVVSDMLIAEDVVDAGGRILVPAGATVTESMLQGLRRREIEHLQVVREIDEDAEARNARLALIGEQVAHRFRKAGEGSETLQLRQAILTFQLESAK